MLKIKSSTPCSKELERCHGDEIASGRRKIVRGEPMMLMSIGAVLLAWAAFILFYEPDGRRKHSR
ncbi:MAG: hypothetical protein R3D69_10760 [Xanthobacteraceae bacterium]